MMNKRDKFLTEAMEECWHIDIERITRSEYLYGRVQQVIVAYTCGKCNQDYINNNDFSSWQGFGKLKESKTLKYKVGSSKFRALLHEALEEEDTPNSFADKLYREMNQPYK